MDCAGGRRRHYSKLGRKHPRTIRASDHQYKAKRQRLAAASRHISQNPSDIANPPNVRSVPRPADTNPILSKDLQQSLHDQGVVGTSSYHRANQHCRPNSPPTPENSIGTIKASLLNQSDWLGIAIKKPLRITFTPVNERESIGRHKHDITSHGYTHRTQPPNTRYQQAYPTVRNHTSDNPDSGDCSELNRDHIMTDLMSVPSLTKFPSSGLFEGSREHQVSPAAVPIVSKYDILGDSERSELYPQSPQMMQESLPSLHDLRNLNSFDEVRQYRATSEGQRNVFQKPRSLGQKSSPSRDQPHNVTGKAPAQLDVVDTDSVYFQNEVPQQQFTACSIYSDNADVLWQTRTSVQLPSVDESFSAILPHRWFDRGKEMGTSFIRQAMVARNLQPLMSCSSLPSSPPQVRRAATASNENALTNFRKRFHRNDYTPTIDSPQQSRAKLARQDHTDDFLMGLPSYNARISTPRESYMKGRMSNLGETDCSVSASASSFDRSIVDDVCSPYTMDSYQESTNASNDELMQSSSLQLVFSPPTSTNQHGCMVDEYLPLGASLRV